MSNYLTIREDSASAHKLLGQALEQLGEKEKALAQYKCSLELESKQQDLVLKGTVFYVICILLNHWFFTYMSFEIFLFPRVCLHQLSFLNIHSRIF